ncbi:MAG: hypothetical protein KKG59_06555, partial [Nanoarchaeota archaeon]|nr:hypothetical protein [Nanoarchaeota archaeon]
SEMQKSFVEKLESLRILLSSRLPQLDVRNLLEIMGGLAHYHYNRKDYLLLGVEKEVYALLIENGYNPFTVYRWLLLERLPEDIRFQVSQRKMSQKKAVCEAFKRKHEGFQELSQSIREYGLSLVARM